jgi:hypothetical protein
MKTAWKTECKPLALIAALVDGVSDDKTTLESLTKAAANAGFPLTQNDEHPDI